MLGLGRWGGEGCQSLHSPYSKKGFKKACPPFPGGASAVAEVLVPYWLAGNGSGRERAREAEPCVVKTG